MSLPIDTELLAALKGSDAPPAQAHLDIAKRTGRLSHNVKRSLKNHIEAGYLDANTLAPTAALETRLEVELAAFTFALGKSARPPAPAGIADPARPAPGETGLVPRTALTVSGLNYRKTFDPDRLDSLAASILSKGILTALTVRPHPQEAGAYQIAAGERRYRATGLLVERGELPADTPLPVICRDMTDAEMLAVALAENMEQETVDPFEEAEGFLRLQQSYIADGRDPGEATGDIAAELGCSQRIVQRRLRTIRDLIPEAREAWADGKIALFAMAEELSRWPEERQADALEEILAPFSDITNAKELRDWLNEDAPPVGEQPFDEELYCAEGGTFIEPEEEGEPRRFARRALAERLTHDWITARAEKLAQEHGYNPGPVIARYRFEHSWPAPPKHDHIPADKKHAFFEYNPETLKVEITHPVVAGEDLRAILNAKPEGNSPAPEGGREPVKPYARRCWLQGAEARTRTVRREIEVSPAAAMALTILAFLGGDREGANYNDSAPLFLQRINPTGDATEVGFGERFAALLDASPCEGIDLSDTLSPVKSRKKAMDALMVRPDLPHLFAAAIADRTIDCRYTAGPGSEPEIRAIMTGRTGGVTQTAALDGWLGAYTKDQLIAHAEAAGIGSAIGGDSLSKKELVDRFQTSAPASWSPPETHFTDAKTMRADVDAILKGGR